MKIGMSIRGDVTRIPIGFDRWYRALSIVVGLRPSKAYLDVDPTHVEVRMGWAFRTRFARSAIVSASVLDIRPRSRGVHGFWGRWLVNGAGHDIVAIRLHPTQRAYVMGVPVGLRELLVSVEEGPSLIAVLRGPA